MCSRFLWQPLGHQGSRLNKQQILLDVFGRNRDGGWGELTGGMQCLAVTMVTRRFAKRLDLDPALAKDENVSK
jgi:hypothetical protein